MKNDFILVNFTDLSLDEKKMVLDWRNDVNIRKWMYTNDSIELESHLSFIENLKINKNKIYFVVKNSVEYLGVIDFYNLNDKNKVIEFGLYANPKIKIAGVGRMLEKISIDYAFETLQANILRLEVFSDNMQVINLHKKFHFKEVDKKNILNKEVIVMELKNEDR